MYSITTDQLSRHFGDITALSHLSLQLPLGGVIGLVGPNGSGKSTLIRILLGLVRPSEGGAEVLGQSIARQRQIAERVGALIESPAFVPALSARANLVSLVRLRDLSLDRVDQVLDTVGLRTRSNGPVKGFSLGMKQRLGIAAALLPEPELLVLDEPTNGLDPAGTVEIRELMRSLGRQGRTVIVSSHMLGEIHAVCDYVVIIKYGHLLFSGPIGELLDQATQTVVVAVEPEEDTDRLLEVIHRVGWAAAVQEDGVHRVVTVEARADQAAAVNQAAMSAGITLSRLTPATESLEELFLRLTARGSDELISPISLQTKNAVVRAVNDRRSNSPYGRHR